MPTNRRSRRRRRADAGTLTANQFEHLSGGSTLLDDGLFEPIGTPGYPFHDAAHRRALWVQFRDVLMQGEPVGFTLQEGFEPAPGWRPDGWWSYESPSPRLPGESQVDALRRMGLLTEAEEQAIAKMPPPMTWR